MIRKIIIVTFVSVLAPALLVAFNTLRLESRQLQVAAAQVPNIEVDAAARRLAEALRFETVSFGPDAPVPGDALFGLRDFLASSFPRAHAMLEREMVGGYSLLFTWRGSDPALVPILISAHMDVSPVEPGTEVDWTNPPFAGAIADGFVWGRGALDMKQSMMGVLEAVEDLLVKDFTPARTVYLAFGHDEEAGGTQGAAKIARLLEKRGVRLQFTLDEGAPIAQGIVPGVAKPVALVGLAEKGKVTLELIARGESGHSSIPPVSTAVGRLGQAIHRLEANQMPARLEAPVVDMFAYLAPDMPLAWRVVLANRWLFEPWLISRLEAVPATNASIRTTTAPTIIRGGVKANVLPNEARAMIDFRILPGDTVADVIEHVRTTVDDLDMTVSQIGSEPSAPTPVSRVDAASFTALQRTIHEVFPEVVVAPSLVVGRTDSRRYAVVADSSYRFLPMRLGPTDLARIHGTNERISVENYAETIRFYIRLLQNTAG